MSSNSQDPVSRQGTIFGFKTKKSVEGNIASPVSSHISHALSQTKPATKKASRGSARSPSSFYSQSIPIGPRSWPCPPINSLPQIVKSPLISTVPFGLYGLPPEIVESASIAAAAAAAEAAAAVAVEYFQSQNKFQELLPSRPVSPSSIISVSSDYTIDSGNTITELNSKRGLTISTGAPSSSQDVLRDDDDGSMFTTNEEKSVFTGTGITESFVQDYLELESIRSNSSSIQSLFPSRSSSAPILSGQNTKSKLSLSLSNSAMLNRAASSSDPLLSTQTVVPVSPVSSEPQTKGPELGLDSPENENQSCFRVQGFHSAARSSSITSPDSAAASASSASTTNNSFKDRDFELRNHSSPPVHLPEPLISDSSHTGFTQPISITHLQEPRSSIFTPNPNYCVTPLASPTLYHDTGQQDIANQNKSEKKVLCSPTAISKFLLPTGCPTPSTSPQNFTDHSITSSPDTALPLSSLLNFSSPPSSTKTRVLRNNSAKLDSSAPVLSTGVDSNNDNNNISNSNQPSKSEPESTPSEPLPSDIWSYFYNFASSTRHSDSLVYALARKEAFLQNKRLPQNGKESAGIIDLWVMMALRYIMKGQLLFSPLAMGIHESKESHIVLDIQGVFRDQWSWQMALDFPKAMVYGFKFAHSPLRRPTGDSQESSEPENTRKDSAASAASASSSPSDSSTASFPTKYNIDSKGFCSQNRHNHQKQFGPSNYIPCIGHSLKKMPFEDNTFDVISAKSLWYFVKRDDWEVVLKELHRIIKPGGCIELVVSDFCLINASETYLPWWSRLREGVWKHGLEPLPGGAIPNHLYNVGYKDVHRALIALPRGWGGQAGHLTDLLALYYAESMFNTFSDLTPEELETFKKTSRRLTDIGHFPANRLSLIYASKES